MLIVQKSKTRRAARFLWALWAALAFCGGSALKSQAQPAPPNDNLTNAQGIIGVSGTVLGTNLQATVQSGEPFPVANVPPSATIWYSWTAPITTEIDFNTRGSVDADGETLDTVLAVYQLKTGAGGLTFANLAQVAGNEDDPSGGVTSRVDFNAAEGTTYFIQVGSLTNTFDGDGAGMPVLNWSPSLVAGGFGFSTSLYLMSSLENWLPDGSPSVTPSLFGFQQGTPNARITVTRTGGYTGRCEVTVNVAAANYTNTYTTNYIGTNIFLTNYTSNGISSADLISYTNTYLTNIAWVNWFTNFEDGVYVGLPVDGDEQIVQTNISFGPTNGGGPYETFQFGPYLTELIDFGQLNVTNFLTNFPCPLGPLGPVGYNGLDGNGFELAPSTLTSTFAITNFNTDGTITVAVTNVFCYQSNTTVLVPASYAFSQFTPLTETLTFDDYQMSQDVYVQIYPILNVIGNGFGERSNTVAVQDFETPGPEDLGEFTTNFDYFYDGLNTYVNVTLSNAVLDAQEDPDIVPPTITQSNALINILNYWGNPNILYSNAPDLYVLINFERYTYRCDKNCGTAEVYVQRTIRGTPDSGDYTVRYTIDSTLPNETVIDDNKFATVADSDYAVPSDGQSDYDFTLPVTPDWTGIEGVLTFPSLNRAAQAIQIPIIDNGAVEFDEDIELQLFQLVPDYSADIGATPPALLGSIDTARLTINFNNVDNGVQPGGAVDRNYNVDDQSDSFPPDNLFPGANSSVNAVAIDANGLAVIGGDFDAFNTTPINYIARLQTDGLMDNTFTTGLGRGPNNFVNAIAIDSSGRIIIGGQFTSVNATNAFYIARLLPTGALDTSFVTGFGFNSNVYALTLDANGNILVGGDFTSFNKTNCNHIARLLPSGGLDPTFLPSSGLGVTNGTDQGVRAVAVDSLGNIILGGNFVTVNGTNWNHIARLLTNGNLDLSFNPGFGADGDVFAVAVQSDNSIILGGAFQNVNLISRNSIARLTPSGVLDTGFAPGTGFDDIVNSLAVQPDGNILVGGQFTMYNGTRRVAMARLLGGQGSQTNEGGWLDTSFMDTAYNQFAGLINHYYNTNAVNTNDAPASSNQRNQVLAMGLQPDGNVVIGGNFWRVGGGFTRTDVHYHQNVARIMGPATPGPNGTLTIYGGQGGLNNCPGNVSMTANAYTVDDTGQKLFVTLDRVNGSLGPARLTLGTNTLPPSSSSATSADFGLPVGTSISYYEDVWNLVDVGANTYGWRKSDGEYGLNNGVQTQGDDGASALFLSINNDPSAAAIIYADLNLLNLNSYGLLSLGGVTMPSGPALGQYTAQLDIVNGNFPTGTLGFSQTNYNVLESAGDVSITLLRTNGDNNSPSVTVVASNGTAINNQDFQWSSSQENFGSSTSITFTNLRIKDYATQQTNKFFYLYLSSPTAGATLNSNVLPTVATVTIIDDHFQPGYLSFSSPAYSVLKPGLATITVNRSGAALEQVSVMVGTSNGTAINGVNYVGVSNQLNWNVSDISPRTFTVQTLQDGTVDGPRTVNLFLYDPQVINGTPSENAQLIVSPSNAVLTIVDTDTNGYLNFLSHNFSVFQNAGQALITVTRTGLGSIVGSETVNFTTYNLTNVQLPYLAGVAGSNYGFTNGQLTFPPGVTSASFAVPVYQTSETTPADRLVGLRLFDGSPTNIAGLLPETAVLTILDPQLHLNSAGSVDTTTQNGVGFNAFVNSLSLQPDASILAGGGFTSFSGYPFDYVGRMVPNGGYDTGFMFNLAGPNNTVWQVFSQPPDAGQIDGNIMIVGDFTQVNQVNSPRIARLNLNGGLDTSFNPGSGADGTVYAITNILLPTSSTNYATNYIIGGAFANYNGTTVGGVARVTSSGLFDTTFNIGFGATGSNAVVHALALTPNNEILVGGDFTSFDNQAHHYLVELNPDGTLNTNFTAFDGVSSDINGAVRALVVQPDGRILLGGLFTTVNGSNYNYVARLNTDGTTDTNFNVGVGCNNNVQALVLDDQLRILVGGAFTQASGVTRNGITRLNPDGTVDPSINFGFGANGFVDTIILQTNDEINVGGGFSTFDNVTENNFVRLFGGANAGNGTIQFSQQVYGVLESPTSSTNAIIGIQRLGGTFGSPSVSAVFSTSNNTAVLNEAVPGLDYIGVTNTVTFPQGETFELVEVPILTNITIGPDLFVTLELTNPPSNPEAIGPQVTSTLIITNDNTGVEFAAQGFNQSATAASVAIPIVRVGNTNTTASVVVYTGTNGTAVPYTNYVPTTNLITFAPGVITNYWLITLSNSPTTFQDTTVDLEMEDATNAIVASPSSALLTINTAQTGPGYLTFSQTNYTVSEGATNAVITVLRTNGNHGTVQFTLTTSPGTALPGINYSNVTAQLTIPDGGNSVTDNIPIIQQANAEPNATVILSLSDPIGTPPPFLSSPTQAVLTIVNDIAAFSFSSSSYFVSEGSPSVTLTVLRTGPTNGTDRVYVSTISSTNAGSAVPGVDYVPITTNSPLNPLVFEPGVALATFPVTILQTTNVNPVLSFQVQLTTNATSGAQVGVPGTATVGIISDVTGFAFASSNYYVGENGSNIVITINRFNANTGSASVVVSTIDFSTNTAVANTDYVPTNETLNFLDGQASTNITVEILNPNHVEADKTFSLTLSNASPHSYVISPSNTLVTITNVYVGFAFGSPSFTVSECATSAVIPVVRSGLTNSTNSVTYGTEDGSGIANVNYFPSEGSLQFVPGQTLAYFYVTPINNHIIGPDHTVQLNLTNNFPVPPSEAGVQLINPSTALLTIDECNGADIIKSGTAFVTGSILPSTGVIYSNDTVTILFGLRDISTNDAVDLTATLVLANGITTNGTNFLLTNNYGTLISNGPTVARPFTFTVEGSNGQNITATLDLSDLQNPTNLNPVSFGFTIGGNTISYTNTNTIFLPENATAPTIATNSVGPGFGYPSLINVSGVLGLLTKATVTFSNFGHSFPKDVDAVLEAPNGSNSILMSHVGSNFGVGTVDGVNYGPPVTLTFDQSAAVFLPLNSKLTNGTYKPTTNALTMPRLPQVPTNEVVPVEPPESPYPYAANLTNAFVGASPNGYWSLWAICDETLDSGYISNGWILNLSTGVPVENDADVDVTITTNGLPTIGNPLTYFVTVTNFGPSGATNLVITDYLPLGSQYLSNSLSGAVTNTPVTNGTLIITVTNDTLIVNLPSLAAIAETNFEVYVLPTNEGYITNVITALALEPDPNSNNMVTNVSLVGPSSADLGINLNSANNPTIVGGSVYFTVEVTNGGPSTASNVVAILTLPAGFVLDANGISVSDEDTATNVTGTNPITWNIGTLSSSSTGVGPTMTVETEPTVAGTFTASASVSSSVFDPLKGNNFAQFKIEVEQAPMLSISGTGPTYVLTWSGTSNYELQGAINLPPSNATNQWVTIGTNGQYTFTLSTTNIYHFFRLKTSVP